MKVMVLLALAFLAEVNSVVDCGAQLPWMGVPVSSERVDTIVSARILTVSQPTEKGTPRGELAVAGVIFGSALFASTREPPGPLECGPCDRSGVFFLDRWAITGLRSGADDLSDVLLLGLVGSTWGGLLTSAA